MEIEKEIVKESEQQGGKEEKKESESRKKARGRPTKAEELAKLRGRTDSAGSIKDLIQKRKREE